MRRVRHADHARAVALRNVEMDEVTLVERLIWKVHLRDQAKAVADDRKVHVGRPPPFDITARNIGAGLDSAQAVMTVGIGLQPSKAVEVRVERRVRISAVERVRVAPVRVCIPDLDERVTNGPAVFVEHSS